MPPASHRPNTSAPTDGSRTMTILDVQPRQEGGEGDDAREPTIPQVTLRLRGAPRSRPRVAWDERVVDNENCGRKKSKICCIYHKPKPFDESSDESSSDSEAGSGSESAPSDDGRARPRRSHRHHHHHDNATNGRPGAENASGSQGSLQDPDRGSTVVHELAHDAEKPNAYESQPLRARKKRAA
ncbi:phosphatase inhibitor-domain-containing protein [Hysterangium stoloniferum]|nr:phosphatase inhibitor-domain-containing protein [Hysterangium stoloniferum]